MNVLLLLIPVALLLGGLGLAAFLWALKSGQFDDLDGAAHRILIDDDPADRKLFGQSRDQQHPKLVDENGGMGQDCQEINKTIAQPSPIQHSNVNLDRPIPK